MKKRECMENKPMLIDNWNKLFDLFIQFNVRFQRRKWVERTHTRARFWGFFFRSFEMQSQGEEQINLIEM